MVDAIVDNPPKRAESQYLYENTSSPLLSHFIPTSESGGQRDRFGNRIITSQKMAYKDREGNETRAGLLVSIEGERFIKENKGILDDIDRGLRELKFGAEGSPEKLDLGNGRVLEFLGVGGQSNIFILEINSKKFLVKKRSSREGFIRPEQPYVNEMLQTQSLATDLKQEFEGLGVELPTFLFASGQIAVREFVEGEMPRLREYEKLGQTLEPTVSDYIEKQKNENNMLWNNVNLDMFVYLPGRKLYDLNNDNWIKKQDGKLVSIDPFAYDSRKLQKTNAVA
jgi:hypothetical protein